MRRVVTFCASLLLIFATSCSEDTVTDEFVDSFGEVPVRLVERVDVAVVEGSNQENRTLRVTYDANNRVSSATDGIDTSIFAYQNNELSTVTGEGDVLDINELYQEPYDLFETGEVTQYDSDGNPVRIRFYEEEFDGSRTEFNAELIYDNNPNPYFYTLEAAGIIEVMDRVRLNFSMTPQSSEIVAARMLFPVSNLRDIVIRDTGGTIVREVRGDYVYGEDSYPISGTFVSTNADGETAVYTISYTYKQ